MSRRGGGGRRGGRGDYPREQHPSVAPAYPTGGGGPRGRGGPGGNGRGRGGGGGAPSAPPAMTSQRAPPPTTSYYSPPADVPSSSAAAAAGSSSMSLSQELEQRLTIRDPTPAAVEPAATLIQSAPASSKALRPPARPGFGKAGRTCIVRANHFLVEVADKSICHYDVAISPESTSRVRNRRIITELVRMHKDGILGRRLPVYDGQKSLYTAGPLPFTEKAFVIKLGDEEKTDKTREKEFKVTIKIAGQADVDHLRNFLRDISATSFYKPVIVVEFVAEYLKIDTMRSLSDLDRIKVCRIVEGQRFTKKLNDRQVTSILKATCQRPRDRERSILEVGGRNTVLEDALHNRIPFVTDKPTIIFGADVTHPAPGEDALSIAAVCFSFS
ncbi:hypothetical protein GW17_00004228 [Ensete ventricosum]|nr:hypothetical protein GW17_00004228 [Ensete ventricosum]